MDTSRNSGTLTNWLSGTLTICSLRYLIQIPNFLQIFGLHIIYVGVQGKCVFFGGCEVSQFCNFFTPYCQDGITLQIVSKIAPSAPHPHYNVLSLMATLMHVN